MAIYPKGYWHKPCLQQQPETKLTRSLLLRYPNEITVPPEIASALEQQPGHKVEQEKEWYWKKDLWYEWSEMEGSSYGPTEKAGKEIKMHIQ
jgi:hypothetical protein